MNNTMRKFIAGKSDSELADDIAYFQKLQDKIPRSMNSTRISANKRLQAHIDERLQAHIDEQQARMLNQSAVYK